MLDLKYEGKSKLEVDGLLVIAVVTVIAVLARLLL